MADKPESKGAVLQEGECMCIQSALHKIESERIKLSLMDNVIFLSIFIQMCKAVDCFFGKKLYY